MIGLLSTLKGGLVVATLLIGGTIAAMLSDIIGESTPVTIGVIVVLAGGLWYLATTIQRMRDDIWSVKEAVARLEETEANNAKHHSQVCPLMNQSCADVKKEKEI